MGTPPLTKAKERSDIPDSFICRAIEKIKENHDELVLIVQDKKIINTFKDIPTYTIHENIDAFINTTNIQEILIVEDKLETLKKYENVIARIQILEFEHHVIEDYLASHIGDTLIGKTIESRTIPSDNNDATISQFGEANKIELNFKNHTYYGDNQIGIQFKLITDVYADFYIYKADYYMLDDDVSFSIDDFNNHYFEAETELFIEVTGIVLIKFDPISDLQADYDDLTEENFEEYLADSYIGNSEIHIESIDTIKVVDSN